MKFLQTGIVRTRDQDGLAYLWAARCDTVDGSAPGYLDSRLLADRESKGRHQLILDLPSAGEARLNNDRVEAQSGWRSVVRPLAETPEQLRRYPIPSDTGTHLSTDGSPA